MQIIDRMSTAAAQPQPGVRSPVPCTGTIEKIVLDVRPHLKGEDESALHEAEHHGKVAYGISA